MRPQYVHMTHKDAGEAQVPPHRVPHYEAKGWKQSKADKSTTNRSTSTAPQGANTASSKEG